MASPFCSSVRQPSSLAWSSSAKNLRPRLRNDRWRGRCVGTPGGACSAYLGVRILCEILKQNAFFLSLPELLTYTDATDP